MIQLTTKNSMPPLTAPNRQPVSASTTGVPRLHRMDATFNPGARPVFEISDDEGPNNESFTVQPQTLHQSNNGHRSRDVPIDLTTDSDDELLSGLGRTRPSIVPQAVKRIRLEPTMQDGACTDTSLPTVFHSHQNHLKGTDGLLLPTHNFEEIGFRHTTGGCPLITPPKLTAMNPKPPLLPDMHEKPSHKKLKKQTLAPYFFDPDLEVTMYRGTGYEQFPIVLGTIKEHQTICNSWDARQQKRQQKKTAKLLLHKP